MSPRSVGGASVLALLVLAGWALAQRGAPAVKDRQLLDRQRTSMSEAFNRNDARAWAAVYAADGDFIKETGEVAKGPAAIQKMFAKLFAENPGVKVEVAMTNERALTPQIVLEDGTFRVTGGKDGRPGEGRYTAVWAHRNGRWLLVSHRSWVPVKAPAP